MKKLLALLCVLTCLLAALLLAPLGIFAYYLSGIVDSSSRFYQELEALSGFVLTEETHKEDVSDQQSHVTISIPEDIVNTSLQAIISEKRLPGFSLLQMNAEIAPEMMSVAFIARYQIVGVTVAEIHVFSEWVMQVSPYTSDEAETGRVLVKPLRIYTNALPSFNWASAWEIAVPYLFRAEGHDGWLVILQGIEQADIEDILFQDQEVLLIVRQS